MVPKMNPMSMTMPRADEAADERLVELAACARMGVNPLTFVKNKLFMFAVLQVPLALANDIGTILSLRAITGFFASPALATGAASIGDV